MTENEEDLTKYYKEKITEKQREFLLKHNEDMGFDKKFIDEISSKEASSIIGNFIKCKEIKRKMIEENKKKIQKNYKELLNNRFFENQNKEIELLKKIDNSIDILIKEIKLEGE